MTKSNQCSLDIADHLDRGEYDWCPEAATRLREQHDTIKQLRNRTIWDKPRESQYVQNTRLAAESGEQG